MVIIHLKTLACKNFDVEIDLEKNVDYLKGIIFQKTGFPISNIRIIYNKKFLTNETLNSYGIKDGTTLIIFFTNIAPNNKICDELIFFEKWRISKMYVHQEKI